MKVWFITEESPDYEGYGASLVCIAKNKRAALQYLQNEILSEKEFKAFTWEISANNPNYHYATGEFNGEIKCYMLCTEKVLKRSSRKKAIRELMKVIHEETNVADGDVKDSPTRQ